MLVLSRKVEQSIRISVPPSDKTRIIDLKVIEIKRHVTRFGFDADRDVILTRHELLPLTVADAPAEAAVPTETPSEAPADAGVPEAV